MLGSHRSPRPKKSRRSRSWRRSARSTSSTLSPGGSRGPSSRTADLGTMWPLPCGSIRLRPRPRTTGCDRARTHQASHDLRRSSRNARARCAPTDALAARPNEASHAPVPRRSHVRGSEGAGSGRAEPEKAPQDRQRGRGRVQKSPGCPRMLRKLAHQNGDVKKRPHTAQVPQVALVRWRDGSDGTRTRDLRSLSGLGAPIRPALRPHTLNGRNARSRQWAATR
jgi:hypothetical protein